MSKRYRIEFRGSKGQLRGIDYNFKLSQSAYEALAQAIDGEVTFTIQLDRDIMYLNDAYEELVIEPPVQKRFANVTIRSSRQLPGTMQSGDVIHVSARIECVDDLETEV